MSVNKIPGYLLKSTLLLSLSATAFAQTTQTTTKTTTTTATANTAQVQQCPPPVHHHKKHKKAYPVAAAHNERMYDFDEEGSWWVAVEIGAAFGMGPSNTTNISVPGQLQQDSYNSQGLGDSIEVGASVGYQFPIHLKSIWLPFYRLGVAYDYFSQANVDGQIIQFPNAHNYDYRYKVSSNTLWLHQQLDIIDFHNFVPFIELGLGVAFNDSQSYSEQAADGNIMPRLQPAGFGSNTNTQFAWRVGAGIAYAISEQVSVSVLYRYTDRGDAVTSNSANNSANGALSTPLRSNDVLASFRYNFDL